MHFFWFVNLLGGGNKDRRWPPIKFKHNRLHLDFSQTYLSKKKQFFSDSQLYIQLKYKYLQCLDPTKSVFYFANPHQEYLNLKI